MVRLVPLLSLPPYSLLILLPLFLVANTFAAEFIAIAETAADTIREMDDIKDDEARYFEASEYPPLSLSSSFSLKEE
jgi:hypothetical protein